MAALTPGGVELICEYIAYFVELVKPSQSIPRACM
jgi:hypothetical protein